MRKLIPMLVLAAIGLNSCGGEEQSLTPAPPPPVTGPGGPEIASIQLVTNNPQIPSDGGIQATITAFVKDESNNFVNGAVVAFAADSGGIFVTQGTTTAEGIATATLTTAGDPTNRTIGVTASAGEQTQNINVFVTGTQLTITGPDSLVFGDEATYTIVLVDGGGNGIAGVTLDVSTDTGGNPLSAATLTTDAAGQAQVTVTAAQGGTDTLRAMGLGLESELEFTVSSDQFAFRSPQKNTEVILGAVQVVTIEWLQDGVPQVGQPVSFSTTRGEFVGIVGPPVVSTDATGRASISVRANNAGPAVITAEAQTADGPSTTLPIEFIATVPFSIDIQADPFTIAPGNQSSLTATVRDMDNNRVKNAAVTFLLQDTTGGTLSVGAGTTDSQGRVQTFYTANDVVSGNEGVTITASVVSDPSISDAVQITVARRELFLAFGTGNEIEIPDIATYEIPFLAIVTDSEGNGVPDADVQFDIRSTRFLKGVWVLSIDDIWFPLVSAVCDDEDTNGNGILDPGEDTNNNMSIEAGNIAAVVGGNALTDAEGKILFSIRYPKVYGTWTEVRLRGKLTVAGTEFTEDIEFVLATAGDDAEPDESPPGLIGPGNVSESPWGTSNTCADDL